MIVILGVRLENQQYAIKQLRLEIRVLTVLIGMTMMAVVVL